MRTILKDTLGKTLPDHVGLAYDRYAPLEDGKIPDNKRDAWLRDIASIALPVDYKFAYERWKNTWTTGHRNARAVIVRLASRLLVGHGHSSPTEVGLTLHPTWGVPMIPGSALKGLLNHYIDAVYGPGDISSHPAHESIPEHLRERARYRGVKWDSRGRVPLHGPGEFHRALFGAPAAQSDPQYASTSGETIGEVVFHDALYVPRSIADDRPLAVDVLTVHQKNYYNNQGRRGGPTDYDEPNPVSFLTVKPGAQFLLALGGNPDWAEFALRELLDALAEWGVGGKTAAGYGRIDRDAVVPVTGAALPSRSRGAMEDFKRWLERTSEMAQRERLEDFRKEWSSKRGEFSVEERKAIGDALKREINSKKLKDERDRLLAVWQGEPS
jgi:CRISPR-associated protein Cmr6